MHEIYLCLFLGQLTTRLGYRVQIQPCLTLVLLSPTTCWRQPAYPHCRAIIKRLVELEAAISDNLHRLHCDVAIHSNLADLRLYRAQLKRLLNRSLYYLRVVADGKTLFKIGVTARNVEERIEEIRADLRPHFQSVDIKLIDCWKHRGSVEHYFKHRHRQFGFAVGAMTEFFAFPDAQAKRVQRDLRTMGSKELVWAERELLADQLSNIERELDGNRRDYDRYEQERRRALAISTGMRRAKRWGNNIGRPKGQENSDAFLNKPKSRAIAKALDEGHSLRMTAQLCGASVNTVRKVKQLKREVRERGGGGKEC